MTNWKTSLSRWGITVDDHGCAEPNAPVQLAESEAWVTPLSSLGVLQAKGRDAAKFLQSQLTNDMEALAPGDSTLAAWCDPKGRAQALLRIYRADDDHYYAVAPATVLDAVCPKLKLFVLRAKVSLERLDTQTACLGLSSHSSTEFNALARFAIGDGRSMVLCLADELGDIFESLTKAQVQVVGESHWRKLDILEGIPQITQSLMGELVPQMMNLELIGGISFHKGCYPGQEVVARAQYLGRIKRRLYPTTISLAQGSSAPVPGTQIVASDGTKVGLVVQAGLPKSQGILDCQVVLRTESVDNQARLHIESPDGPVVNVMPPPYSLVAPESLTARQ